MTEMTNQQKIARIKQAIENGAHQLVIKGRTPDGQGKNIQYIIEEVKAPPEGGNYVKFYEINNLWKGAPTKHTNDIVHLGKTVIYQVPQILFAKSKMIMAYFGFLFLFRTNKFWHLNAHLLQLVSKRSIKKLNIDETKYNRVEKEIKRAGEETLNNILTKDQVEKIKKTSKKPDKLDRYRVIKSFLDFFALVIYSDAAYRFRLQDLSREFLIQDIKKGTIKRIREAMKMAEERERQSAGLIRKYRSLRVIIPVVIIRDSKVRDFVKKYLQEIDLEKCLMDEDDQYFAYLIANYKYGGLEPEEMEARWEKLEKKYNNYYWTLCCEENRKK